MWDHEAVIMKNSHYHLQLCQVHSGDITNSQAWVWVQLLLLLLSEVHEMFYNDANFLSCRIRQQQRTMTCSTWAVHQHICKMKAQIPFFELYQHSQQNFKHFPFTRSLKLDILHLVLLLLNSVHYPVFKTHKNEYIRHRLRIQCQANKVEQVLLRSDHYLGSRD